MVKENNILSLLSSRTILSPMLKENKYISTFSLNHNDSWDKDVASLNKKAQEYHTSQFNYRGNETLRLKDMDINNQNYKLYIKDANCSIKHIEYV